MIGIGLSFISYFWRTDTQWARNCYRYSRKGIVPPWPWTWGTFYTNFDIEMPDRGNIHYSSSNWIGNMLYIHDCFSQLSSSPSINTVRTFHTSRVIQERSITEHPFAQRSMRLLLSWFWRACFIRNKLSSVFLSYAWRNPSLTGGSLCPSWFWNVTNVRGNFLWVGNV